MEDCNCVCSQQLALLKRQSNLREASFKKEKGQLQQNFDLQKAEMTSLQKTIANLRSVNETLVKALEDLNCDKKTGMDIVTQLKSFINEQNRTSMNMSSSHAFVGDLLKTKQELGRLTGQLQSKRKELLFQKDERERLQVQLEQFKKECKCRQAQEVTYNYNTTNNYYQKQNQMLRSKLQKCSPQVVQDLNQRVYELENINSELTQQNQSLRGQVKTLREQLSKFRVRKTDDDILRSEFREPIRIPARRIEDTSRIRRKEEQPLKQSQLFEELSQIREDHSNVDSAKSSKKKQFKRIMEPSFDQRGKDNLSANKALTFAEIRQRQNKDSTSISRSNTSKQLWGTQKRQTNVLGNTRQQQNYLKAGKQFYQTTKENLSGFKNKLNHSGLKKKQQELQCEQCGGRFNKLDFHRHQCQPQDFQDQYWFVQETRKEQPMRKQIKNLISNLQRKKTAEASQFSNFSIKNSINIGGRVKGVLRK